MSYHIGGADIARMEMTYSLGLTPASASLSAPGSPSVSTGGTVTITLGGLNFYGIVSQLVTTTNQPNGQQTEIQIVDNRVKLMWDDVYCTFNNAEVREDNPDTPGIDRQKRFWHILPDNWDAQIKTWTSAPFSASTIISYLLSAPTVSNSWTVVNHAAQSKPVYNIHANDGAKLGSVLQEIGEQQGLVFTLTAPAQLTFYKKGDGVDPDFPATSTDRRDGEALSNNDTNIRVVGDRNRYQDYPIDLQESWNTNFEQFWSEPFWLSEVARVFGFVGESLSEQAALVAKARSVTVREYNDAVGGGFEDVHCWGEVGRMDIPAWTYIQDIVFKAYAVPAGYSVNGIPLSSIEMMDGLLAAVTFDIDSGELSLKFPTEYYPDTKAYVIAKGQPLDLLDPRTQTAITEEQLNDAANKWSAQNRFNLDVKNNLVIFEHAVFEAVGGLFLFPNHDTDMDSGDPLYDIAVPNADVQVRGAAVRASLVFNAEKYSRRFGSGVRKAPKYLGALNYHAIMNGGIFQSEVVYADGKTVDQKATEYAAAQIAQDSVYRSGGYTRKGTAGTVLSGVVDRVTVSLDWSDALVERVEFTKERAQSNFEPERELDRKSKARDLFPGQKNNRVEVERLQLIAKLSREIKRSSPTGYGTISEVIQRPVGSSNSSVSIQTLDGDGHHAGEVFWKPDDTFGGIVVAESSSNHAAVATDGTVPVRVKGPVSSGDSVGCVDTDHVDCEVNGAELVGTAMGSYDGEDTVLVPVQLSQATGGPGPGPFKCEKSGDDSIRVYYGTVGSPVTIPDGMTEGDVPPYIITPDTSSGVVCLAVVVSDNGDGNDGNMIQAYIQCFGDPPDDEDTIFYLGIGSFNTVDGKIVVTSEGQDGNGVGTQTFELCGKLGGNPIFGPA